MHRVKHALCVKDKEVSLLLPSPLTICLAFTITKRFKKQLHQVQKKMLLVLAF